MEAGSIFQCCECGVCLLSKAYERLTLVWSWLSSLQWSFFWSSSIRYCKNGWCWEPWRLEVDVWPTINPVSRKISNFVMFDSFILEGLLTVIVAIAAYYFLCDFPETASFLTEEERRFVIWRLRYQGSIDMRVPEQKSADEKVETAMVEDVQANNGRGLVAEAEEFEWKYVWDAFSDWQIWVNIFVRDPKSWPR